MERQYTKANLRSFDSENNKATFVASSAAQDRHGTVVNQKNWHLDSYRANPIVGYQHELYGAPCEKSDPDDVIGRGHVYFEENRDMEDQNLMIDIEFDDDPDNDRARKVARKVERGFLNAVSVGFIPVGEGRYGRVNEKGEVEEKDTFFFDGQELLEVSVVNIPSNPEAVQQQLRSRTYDAITYMARHFNRSFSDIEKMTVGQVIELFERGEVTSNEEEEVANPTDEQEQNKELEEEKFSKNSLAYNQKLLSLQKRK